jgi:hypothetical protein
MLLARHQNVDQNRDIKIANISCENVAQFQYLETKGGKKNSLACVRQQNIQTERPPLVGEVSANFLLIEGCHVVSTADAYSRNHGFLDWSRYYSFQVDTQLQLYSRG